MLVATRTSRMCSLCGVGAHAPPGCLSKTGTKAMGVKAAARVANGALTTMPRQQWQRWRCTRTQTEALIVSDATPGLASSLSRRCHWGTRAAVCGKAQYRGPRCMSCGRGAWPVGGADRRAKRAAIARNGGSALTVATLCPCGAPACRDAAAARVRERRLERHPFLKTVLGSPQQLDSHHLGQWHLIRPPGLPRPHLSRARPRWRPRQ